MWKQVGLGKVHRAVAGAVSNLVVKVVETAQYELAMDYPDFLYYRGVINHLVRNVDADIIGSVTEGRRAAMRDAEAGLLLNTHNDLVQFMIEVRKQRNGIPGPSLKSVNWNPNFVSAESERSLITPERMCQWKADYTISWLYDPVNTYASQRVGGLKNSQSVENAEKLDWGIVPLKTT